MSEQTDEAEIQLSSDKIESGCSCLLIAMAFGVVVLSLAGAYSMIW